MKVLFVGPTLPDANEIAGRNAVVMPPACQGDIHAAVREGANVVGLIDGNFEYVAPIWHKEILHALSLGVRVFGSSSMGALRAAECSAFGMIGVGNIFQRYASGDLVDDAAVAQLHAPPEFGYRSLTLPAVNVHATLGALLAARQISARESALLENCAESLFFKERTATAIVANAFGTASARGADILKLLTTSYVDQKRIDALELIEDVFAADDSRMAPPADWHFNATSMWKSAFKS